MMRPYPLPTPNPSQERSNSSVLKALEAQLEQEKFQKSIVAKIVIEKCQKELLDRMHLSPDANFQAVPVKILGTGRYSMVSYLDAELKRIHFLCTANHYEYGVVITSLEHYTEEIPPPSKESAQEPQ
jgi:hypothetical protein